jgi:hypothetical protein
MNMIYTKRGVATMKINLTTMLFEDLSYNDANELAKLAEEIIMGKLDWNHRFLQSWFNTCWKNEDQKLLVVATVFPQRALLSVVKHYQSSTIRI